MTSELRRLGVWRGCQGGVPQARRSVMTGVSRTHGVAAAILGALGGDSEYRWRFLFSRFNAALVFLFLPFVDDLLEQSYR